MANAKRKNRPRKPRPKLSTRKRHGLLWLGSATLSLTILVWACFQFAKNRAAPSAGKVSSERRSDRFSGAGGTEERELANPTTPGEWSGVRALQANSPPGRGQELVDAARDQSAAGSKTVPVPPATLEVAQAVMVTVELDFGSTVPTIAAALLDIERRSQPDDGKGRTFAILDAYGERTLTGKLHLSMHVSAEKPGIGSLIFKRTGETLWSSRIVPSKDPKKSQFSGKNLSIYIDDGAGKLLTVDGSNNPSWIMDAVVKEKGALLDTVWPSGVEHEVTFIYSACGCPVKVMARREGDRVVRTKELPVMFPDDPAAVEVIAKLMRW